MSAKRYQTLEQAKIEIYGQAASLNAQMTNLSKTGAFFLVSNTRLLPKQGDLISFTVHLNSIPTERKVNAEVVWTNGLGLGVSFVTQDAILDRMFTNSSAKTAI